MMDLREWGGVLGIRGTVGKEILSVGESKGVLIG